MLGRRYDQAGLNEGERALETSTGTPPRRATSPRSSHATSSPTTRPPPRSITWPRSSPTAGDLKAVSIALVERAEPWRAAQSKVKSPNDLVLSSFRALTGHTGTADGFAALVLLGQPPFAAPSPAGYRHSRCLGWPGSNDAAR
jgi:uncharacterized protein (DUF1800 family)